MAKKGKISPENKKALKTTLVFLCLFAVAAGVYLFLNHGKEGSFKPTEASKKAVSKDRVSYPAAAAPVKIKKSQQPPSLTKTLKRTPVTDNSNVGGGAKIAFVLDDWGYRMNNCRFLKEIKEPLAIAVLPGLRHSDNIMKCASLYDKDIMLHLPLEPYHTADKYPDYYLIKTTMPKAKVESLLDDTFKKMPLIIGVNNHMGSKATEHRELMTVVLKKIRKKGLFFVDSMTAPKGSICGALADELKVPFAKRDVFLDNINTREAIEKQMIELAQKARRQGYAIAIGHDRTLTMQVIKDSIPVLQKQGFKIVSIRELLRNTNRN